MPAWEYTVIVLIFVLTFS